MATEPNPPHLLPDAPMDFTTHELELLVDAINWELHFLREKGLHDCRRAEMLRSLQVRIELSAFYRRTKKDLTLQ